jgi:hypothetical protein
LLTHAVDDLRSIDIANDAGECFPDVAQVRELQVEKIQDCTSIVARTGDRLRDFVSERGGQFSHHAHAVYMGEFALQFTQRLLGPLRSGMSGSRGRALGSNRSDR